MSTKDKLFSDLGHFLRTVFDLILLNFLAVLCSLPVITAGASACALFYVELKMARDESSAPIQEFFSAFKDNFRKGVLFGLIALAAAGILFVDYSFAFAQEGSFRTFFFFVCGTVSAIWLIYVSYIFALQARYENSIRAQIKNCFFIAFCAPGKTILMWLIYAVPVALIVLLPFEAAAHLGIYYLILGISGPVYFSCKVLRKIFELFDKKESNTDEQRRSDEAC